MTPDDEEREPGAETAHPSRTSMFPADERYLSGANDEALVARLHFLQQEHADLDMAIKALAEIPAHDSLALARLKKRKLGLKDQIQAVKDQLTPDIIA